MQPLLELPAFILLLGYRAARGRLARASAAAARPPATGEPLPDAACGRGRVVDTSDMDVEYQLDYQTS